jgi:RNA polymerase sigma-70 factor, ECF subfamily
MTDSRNKWEDDPLLEAIRAGEESAFSELVDRYQLRMLKTARAYVGDPTAAEEVVQETWLAFVRGISKFKHRSSLKTWLFGILINQARKHAARRPKELSGGREAADDEYDASSEWFDKAGEWRSKPSAWSSTPESELLSKEAVDYIYDAIAALPDRQRVVITMRDLEGWTSEEVCDLIKITKTNQRVLLHLARSKVQQMLDGYFAERRKAPAAPETEGSDR